MKSKTLLYINICCQILAFGTNALINFFLARFLISKLGIEAYGFIGLSNDFIQYALLFTVALNTMASRFITISITNGNDEMVNKYFSSVNYGNLIITNLIFLVFTIIIFNLNRIINIPSGLVSDVKMLWFFIGLNFVVTVLGSLYSIAPYAKNKLYLISFSNLASYFIKAMILIVMFNVWKTKVWYIGFASLIATTCIFFINYYITKKLLPKLKIRRNFFDWKVIKELVSSGIWSSVSKLSGILASGLDLIIANLYVGPSSMGILSLSKVIPTVIMSFISVISSVFSPQITILYAKGEKEKMLDEVIHSLKLLGIISSIIITLFIIVCKDFYTLWVPSEDSVFLQKITLISCIYLMIVMPITVLNNIYVTYNKLKLPSVSVFISGIFIILIEVLVIPTLTDASSKLIVIVLSTVICELIRNLIFIPIYCSKLLGVDYSVLYKQIFKNIAYSFLLILICSITYKYLNSSTWLKLAVNISIIAVLQVVITIVLYLNSKERLTLKKYF